MVERTMHREHERTTRGLFAWFVPGGHRLDAEETVMLLPAQFFDAQLQQERARADRNGAGFVVLSFDVEMESKSVALRDRARRILAESVASGFRLCDTKGWHGKDGGAVGAILPDTTESQSYAPVQRTEKQFFEKIQNEFPGLERIPQLRCDVFSYPGEGSWGRAKTNGNSAIQFNLADLPESVVAVSSTNGNGNGISGRRTDR